MRHSSFRSDTDPVIPVRLADFLRRRSLRAGVNRDCGAGGGLVKPLAADASARRYFRVSWQDDGLTAVAAVYPEPFDPASLPFLEVARLMEAARLPIPAILEVDGERGIIVQEDLGDCSLRMALQWADPDRRRVLLEDAARLIARIQEATPLARGMDSIAARRALDLERFLFEHRYFQRHFVESLGGGMLTCHEGAEEELAALATELAALPRVLCHRDYHVDNLLVDARGRLRFVDYQDACLGPSGYDLASLLYDRHRGAPRAMDDTALVDLFLVERGIGAGKAEFLRTLPLVVMQRGLLAIGVFARQTVLLGATTDYRLFLRPTLEILRRMATTTQHFPALRQSFENWLAHFPRRS